MRGVFVKKRGIHLPASNYITVLLFIAVVSVVLMAVGNLSRESEEESLQAMERAVLRSATQCYALEGRYPPSVDYLRRHYGLVLHEEKYIYHYVKAADNILPDIQVLKIK
jgi:hypothetical protein